MFVCVHWAATTALDSTHGYKGRGNSGPGPACAGSTIVHEGADAVERADHRGGDAGPGVEGCPQVQAVGARVDAPGDERREGLDGAGVGGAASDAACG